jgi:putative transcriptional regulator
MAMMKPLEPIKREWLKQLRNERKLTIRGIAPLIGMSWQHYSDIESGRRNPSVDLSLKMAKFFNVDVNQFFEDRTKFEEIR